MKKFSIRDRFKKKAEIFKDADEFADDFFEVKEEKDEGLDKIKNLLDEEYEKFCQEEFKEEFPGKHAIWRGNPTKAYLKWKADNNK